MTLKYNNGSKKIDIAIKYEEFIFLNDCEDTALYHI